ncbi:hypothetical protein PIIN_05148 [Serendipita indica DSM 11827]|uniref:Uncharacterized protein n=1 Tax=Serendipita indica (strain DSM 11827) TaxID=1109443 RepID=G4TIR1_SERID|nr:hypothetical protein PIIN_05148 [Serendipita indica DSM 11827]
MYAPAILKSLLALAVLAVAPAAAELSVTSPIATTTCTGGQTCEVAWRDNGEGVTLAQQGLCTVALYVGGRISQTFLQPIAFPTAINVSTTAAIQFVVDPSVGEDSSEYFIRFSSQTLTQANSTTGAPYLSFSAKFRLTGMTGRFNETVQAQISSSALPTPTGNTATSAGTTSTRSTTRASTSTPGAASRNSAVGAAAGAIALAGLAALL